MAQPILPDALAYLDKIKSITPQTMYEDFLTIMGMFKDGVVGTSGVKGRVAMLFADYPDLIQGFDAFLPPGRRMDHHGPVEEEEHAVENNAMDIELDLADDEELEKQQQAVQANAKDSPPGEKLEKQQTIKSTAQEIEILAEEEEQAQIDDTSRPFVCTLCNRRFRRQEHLTRHYRSLHTYDKPFECSDCGKTFSRSDNLSQHQRTMHGQRGTMADDDDEDEDEDEELEKQRTVEENAMEIEILAEEERSQQAQIDALRAIVEDDTGSSSTEAGSELSR